MESRKGKLFELIIIWHIGNMEYIEGYLFVFIRLTAVTVF